MAYKISEECIMCGLCQANCPADAISEGDDRYVIDPELCISCGTCAENCPMGAIADEPEEAEETEETEETVPSDEEEGGLTMAYKISDSCIMCGLCQANCPADAISEGDAQYVIDPEKCISCGTCADNCPAGAISEE